MNYQKLILAGNATDQAQHRTAKKGNIAFTTFKVAVSDYKDRSTFFPVTLFGSYSESLAKRITKGRLLLVEGRIEVKGSYFNVVADKVELGAPTGEAQSTQPLAESQKTKPAKESQETK